MQNKNDMSKKISFEEFVKTQKEITTKTNDRYYVSVGNVGFVVYAENIKQAKKNAYLKHFEYVKRGELSSYEIYTPNDVKILSEPRKIEELINFKIEDQKENIKGIKKDIAQGANKEYLLKPNKEKLDEYKKEKKKISQLKEMWNDTRRNKTIS